MGRSKAFIVAIFFVFIIGLILPVTAWAIPSTSSHYRLDPDTFNTAGGSGSSTNYKLLSSVGEPLIGNGSGGSYQLTAGYVSQLQQSIQLSVNPSGMYAYYPMDTNTGKVAYDTTTTGLNAAFNGTPTWTASGKISNGLTFSGAPYLTTSGTLPSFSGITWGGWIKPSTTTTGTVLSTNDVGTNDLKISSSKFVSDFFIGGSNRTVTGTTTMTAGTWYFVMASYNGSVLTLYVNGVAEGTPVTGLSGSITPGGTLQIADSTFNGTLDEMTVFNRGLNANEVRDMYNAQSAGVRSALTLPSVTPGASQTVSSDITVLTDAGGYDLAIQQNNNLKHTDTVTTIPAISPGDITTPALWSEGTTTGLGFTLTSGVSLPAKWGSSPNYKYAAIPSSSTTFFSRTGLSAGVKEVTSLQDRLDVATSQKSGAYTNTVTLTATTKP